jgi:hypothetical protein
MPDHGGDSQQSGYSQRKSSLKSHNTNQIRKALSVPLRFNSNNQIKSLYETSFSNTLLFMFLKIIIIIIHFIFKAFHVPNETVHREQYEKKKGINQTILSLLSLQLVVGFYLVTVPCAPAAAPLRSPGPLATPQGPTVRGTPA